MTKKILLLLVLAGVMAGGCRSTKKIRKEMAKPSTTVRADTTGLVVRDSAVGPVSAADLKADSAKFIAATLGRLAGGRIDFQTFSGKLKVHYEGGDGKDYEFNAFLRVKKDSVMWVSINAALGIEAFRILITPDSVKILDKLKKVVRMRSVSYLQDEVHLPVDFHALQDLLVGNPVYLDSNNVVFYKKEVGGAVSLLTAGDVFKNFLTLNADATLRHSKLDDTNPMRARTCDLTYGDYENAAGAGAVAVGAGVGGGTGGGVGAAGAAGVGGGNAAAGGAGANGMGVGSGAAGSGIVKFSTYRKITVAEKSRADIEISYKQYKFNEVFNIPFSIPKNYKRK